MSLASAGRESARRVSTRNPRRRQRLDSDSLGHQPRRKRSKVTSETFDGPSIGNETLTNGGLLNGHTETRSRRSATPADSLDIPLRSKKSTQKRAPRNDAGLVMTHTSHYALRQLSSTPDAIRRSASDFTGSILSAPSLALAVTREHAYIWDHTSPTPVLQPRTFDVPYHTKPSEPLPLGHLITTGASSSVGLVLVSATSGEVTYWENIETAESLSLFQDRHSGIKGSIGGLFSGEVVNDIVPAEHAGVVLTLSSGRISQVNLRDAQGKPKIQAQFLRSRDGNSGGLFGSIKGVFGMGWKQDLVGVRTRSQGSKGQMQVISATSSAQVQLWDLAWSGQCNHRESIDFREMLQSELSAPLGGTSSSKHDQASVVDFGVLPTKGNGMVVSLISEDNPIDLVFLVRKSSAYYLVEVTLIAPKVHIERVTELKGYNAVLPDEKPRLLLPQPGHSAVVVFPEAIAVMGLADLDTSGPDAQLFQESHRAPKLFQDVIYLRSDSHAAIESACVEDADERTKQSNCMLFIKGVGLVRLSVSDSSSNAEIRIPVKVRLEQAIYFGAQSNSIVDFTHIDRNAYSQEDVEESALQVSEELLASSYPHLSSSFPTVGKQTECRQRLAIALIGFVRRHFGPISRVTCWRLMNDCEKLKAGQLLFEDWNKAVERGDRFTPSVIPAVVKILTGSRGDSKKGSDPDDVRRWFKHDLQRLDQLVSQSLGICRAVYNSKQLDNIIKMLSECDDIILIVFQSVFDFRSSHADIYGINPADIIDGILEEGWEDLPEPWSGTHELLNSFDGHVDNARTYSVEFYDARPEDHDEVDDYYVTKVVQENCKMVNILCKCYQERIGWCSSHYAEKYRNYAPGLKDRFKKSRDHHMRGLIKIGQAASGLDVAERYGDMDNLVSLVMSESAYLAEMRDSPDVDSEERRIIGERMDGLTKRIKGFFNSHGDAFANVYFNGHLEGHRSYGLLMDQSEGAMFKAPLTKYLRAEGSRGKLGWINEVLNTGDLGQAQVALHTLAKDHERKLWNKKVELSLAKLTAMASLDGRSQPAADVVTESIDHDLSLIKIQEAIYNHFSPMITTAVDHEAEVQLVSDAYAVTIRQSFPNLAQLLERNIDNLLNHAALSIEELIDVLTLMDSVPCAEPEFDISGREFHLALQALQAARPNLHSDRFQMLLCLIWKRCYVQDSWDLISKTKGRSDEKIAQRVRETTTCLTISLGLSDVLTPGSLVTVAKPLECLGAGCSADGLKRQFPQPDLREPILKDNKKQDGQLRDFVEKHQLQKWVDIAVQEAKRSVEEAIEKERAESKEMEGQLEGALEGENGQVIVGTVNGVNGDGNDSFDEMEHDEEPVEDGGAVQSVETQKKVNGTHLSVKGKDMGKENELEGRTSKRLLRSMAGRDEEGDVEMS
ncbi:hypothetical protein CAC42_6598 [Sphaceloma murrayae]|uniref:Non-repetitive/WGA-negative nucleoporin C-terminal-domain-containing protein n=1 Tax=Sphaceloma murrayae TaxID=2082308 RepID=A0A2K1QG08_9PEZI|nr:hypothetical protein CAC42_6598 [Sphaceloma murrayae]